MCAGNLQIVSGINNGGGGLPNGVFLPNLNETFDEIFKRRRKFHLQMGVGC